MARSLLWILAHYQVITVSEQINTGLRLAARRSVKGKGTTKTSRGSKVTPGVLVLGREPFAHQLAEPAHVL